MSRLNTIFLLTLKPTVPDVRRRFQCTGERNGGTENFTSETLVTLPWYCTAQGVDGQLMTGLY